MQPYPCPCPSFTPIFHLISFSKQFTLQWRLCQTCPPNFPSSISYLVTTPASTKWFGLGMRPTSVNSNNLMAQSDMAIGLGSSNPPSLTDFWCDERTILPDPQNNIINATITVDQTNMYSQWFRHFDTGDTDKDHAVTVDNELDWIWTVETGSTNLKPERMPVKRGTQRFKLTDHMYTNSTNTVNFEGTSGDLQNVNVAHGVIMGVGWGIFMPLSALAARYSRTFRSAWLNEHVALTKVGATGTISFVIVAIAAGPQSIAEAHLHAFVGVFFALVVLFVTVSGSLAKTGLKNEAKSRSKNTFTCCRIFHIVGGWFLVLLGFFQIPLGVEVLFNGVVAAVPSNWMDSFPVDNDGSLRENVVIRIAALVGAVAFVVAIVAMECYRHRTGYYEKAGGCFKSCGRLTDDPNLDAFVKRTKHRFSMESQTSRQNVASMGDAVNTTPGKTTEETEAGERQHSIELGQVTVHKQAGERRNELADETAGQSSDAGSDTGSTVANPGFATTPAGHKKTKSSANPVLPVRWKAVKDPASGRTYYFNVVTKETTWDVPPSTSVEGGGKRKGEQGNHGKENVGTHVENPMRNG